MIEEQEDVSRVVPIMTKEETVAWLRELGYQPKATGVEVPADWYAALQAAQPRIARAIKVLHECEGEAQTDGMRAYYRGLSVAVRAALLPTPKE